MQKYAKAPKMPHCPSCKATLTCNFEPNVPGLVDDNSYLVWRIVGAGITFIIVGLYSSSLIVAGVVALVVLVPIGRSYSMPDFEERDTESTVYVCPECDSKFLGARLRPLKDASYKNDWDSEN